MGIIGVGTPVNCPAAANRTPRYVIFRNLRENYVSAGRELVRADPNYRQG